MLLIEKYREEIQEEVRQYLIENGYAHYDSNGAYRPNRGSCYMAWEYEKKLLKERYGIDWKTPAEENPEDIYD